MTARLRFFCVLGLLLGFIPAVQGQTYVVPLPDFSVTSGTPVTINSISAAPVMTRHSRVFTRRRIGRPDRASSYSSDLQMSVTPNGVPTSSLGYMDGNFDSNPYTFGFGVNSARTINYLTGTLPSSTTGTLSATFTTDYAGSTANLANVAIHVFTNPQSTLGTTTGAPTFNRPIVDGSGLSTVGTAVRYAAHNVTVSQTGDYMFAHAAGYDGLILMYQNSFSPGSPLTNYMTGADDDLDAAQPSAFRIHLLAGQNYVLVSTSYTNTDFGDFTVYGAGPGTVTFLPVPEPIGLLALSAIGGFSLRSIRRYRSRHVAAPV